MNKVVLIIFLVILILTVLALSYFIPDFLAGNKFLEAFVTFEILNLLAVIVTVTFASVANIHLSLNKLVMGLKWNDENTRERVTEAVRKELNDDSKLLLLLFLATILMLFAKGANPPTEFISAIHGLTMVILLANIVVLYEIYSAVFKLAKLEAAVK